MSKRFSSFVQMGEQHRHHVMYQYIIRTLGFGKDLLDYTYPHHCQRWGTRTACIRTRFHPRSLTCGKVCEVSHPAVTARPTVVYIVSVCTRVHYAERRSQTRCASGKRCAGEQGNMVFSLFCMLLKLSQPLFSIFQGADFPSCCIILHSRSIFAHWRRSRSVGRHFGLVLRAGPECRRRGARTRPGEMLDDNSHDIVCEFWRALGKAQANCKLFSSNKQPLCDDRRGP